MQCITCSDDDGLTTFGSKPRNVRSAWLAPVITYRVFSTTLVRSAEDELGEGVSEWKKGQRAGVGWHGGHDGTCLSCRDNAKWERIFAEKFADPTYYSGLAVRYQSPLRTLS